METPKKELNNLIVAQYNRAATDFRQFDQSMWQIPSVAITVASFVFIVSLNYVHVRLFSGLILITGSVFTLTLAIAVTKFRLSQDIRSHFLKELDNEYGYQVLPLETREMSTLLEQKGHKHWTPGILRNRRAIRYLLFSVILLFILQIGIGIYFVISVLLSYIPAI